MTLLTKQGLLAKHARRFKSIVLPGGVEARIRSLSAGEMRTLRSSMLDKKGELIRKRGDRLGQLLIAWCLVDEDGNRILSDDDAMGAEFDELDGATVNFLFTQCREWTGFSGDVDWQAIEDTAKNSDATGGNGSSAGSHEAGICEHCGAIGRDRRGRPDGDARGLVACR